MKHRENTRSTQENKQNAARHLLAGLGADKRVEDLTANEVARYIQLRKRGTGCPDGGERPRVRTSTTQADLVLLRTMINWAITVKLPRGEWRLEENPLRGVRLPRERNPRRPLTTFDRYERVRAAIQRLAAEATSDQERARWVRLELALLLAEATGRRLGAIRGLRWSDSG
jgi:integrase